MKNEDSQMELLKVANKTILGLKEAIEGHEALMQEALEELERCSPNAPVTDKLRARLEER